MKILFLNPLRLNQYSNITVDLRTPYISTPSLTFVQLASYIPGKEITIIDGQVENISLKVFLEKLKGVDIVVISIHSSYGARCCEINIEIIKKNYPKIKIIMGGYHATFFYQRWLNIGVDFVLLYEAERYFKELIECLDKGRDYRNINNLAYKDYNKIIVNEIGPAIFDLDSTPIPRFDLINLKNYFAFFPGDGYAGAVELSRGCPYKCNFCLTSRYWNHYYRRKSNQRIMNELQLLTGMNVSKIWFYTTSFGIMPEEDFTLCDLIEKSNMKINWRTPIRMDIVLKFPELIKKAARVGLKLALIGYESFDYDTILALKKTGNQLYNFDNFKKAYCILKENNILVEGSFIIGSPNESKSKELFSSKKINQVCDFMTIQVYRPNVAILPEVLDKGPDNNEYKRLFYFNAYISEDIKLKKVVLKRIKIHIKYYFNPIYICSRLFLRGSLMRRLYLCYYRYFIKNLFRTLTFKIIHRKNIKFSYLT